MTIKEKALKLKQFMELEGIELYSCGCCNGLTLIFNEERLENLIPWCKNGIEPHNMVTEDYCDKCNEYIDDD